MKILVLGSAGMIGYGIFSHFYEKKYDVYGSLQASIDKKFFHEQMQERLLVTGDLCKTANFVNLIKLIKNLSPEIIINCIGLTKHKFFLGDEKDLIFLNSFLPFALDDVCEKINSKLVHISTDCVFSGKSGDYTELDNTDAYDLYGKSKALGEVSNSRSVTIRTSTIGFELKTKFGLLEWFLSQEIHCQGFTSAIYSGVPVAYLSFLIEKFFIANLNLHGLYNVSSVPISKYDLLNLISSKFNKKIKIIKNNTFVIDRSLNSTKLQLATSNNFKIMPWSELIKFL